VPWLDKREGYWTRDMPPSFGSLTRFECSSYPLSKQRPGQGELPGIRRTLRASQGKQVQTSTGKKGDGRSPCSTLQKWRMRSSFQRFFGPKNLFSLVFSACLPQCKNLLPISRIAANMPSSSLQLTAQRLIPGRPTCFRAEHRADVKTDSTARLRPAFKVSNTKNADFIRS